MNKFVVNEKEKAVEGELQIGGGTYQYRAFPMTVDITIELLEAQEEENTPKLLKAYDRYFEECVEFGGIMSRKVKQDVKRQLQRSGKFFEFINDCISRLGKLQEAKD